MRAVRRRVIARRKRAGAERPLDGRALIDAQYAQEQATLRMMFSSWQNESRTLTGTRRRLSTTASKVTPHTLSTPPDRLGEVKWDSRTRERLKVQRAVQRS